jgi:hypothetical protein
LFLRHFLIGGELAAIRLRQTFEHGGVLIGRHDIGASSPRPYLTRIFGELVAVLLRPGLRVIQDSLRASVAIDKTYHK